MCALRLPHQLADCLCHCIYAGIGWQAGRNGVMAPRDGGKLTFSFDAEVAGGVSALRRDQSVRFSDVRSASGAACVLVPSVCICVRPFLTF